MYSKSFLVRFPAGVQQPQSMSEEPTVSSLLINDGLMLSLLLFGGKSIPRVVEHRISQLDC